MSPMDPERWQKIDKLLDAALSRSPAERDAFLAEACGSDEKLRHEVERLLRSDEAAERFIETPVAGLVAGVIAVEQADASVGGQLGHYKILSRLGAGGVGVVYLALDTKLNRRVALKRLSSEVAADKGAVKRLLREARAAAALDHPNICAIHEIGEDEGCGFIVMQYVEGETLAARLRGGPLSERECLDLATQIAGALQAAHSRNVIHRDIKPANIMITPGGQVKVLDFGLAKFVTERPQVDGEGETMSLLTDPGLIVGTLPYMSPEQVRGEALDARSDVFSLGITFLEMLSGRHPFIRHSQAETISAILTEEPSTERVTGENADELRKVLRRCLAKEKDLRYQTTDELVSDLKSFEREPTRATKTPIDEGERARKKWVLGALAVGLLVFAVAVVWLVDRNRDAPKKAEVGRTVQVTTWSGLDFFPALSADGNIVAFSSDRTGKFEIYVKQLVSGADEAQLTSDGRQNFQPDFSPDGRLIAYHSKDRGGVWVVPVMGGTARQISEFGSQPAWSRDGSRIAFQSDPLTDVGFNANNALPPSTIWLVSPDGGEAKQLTQVAKPPGGHGAPAWSPDGKRIVFDANDYSLSSVWSVSLQGYDLKHISGDIRNAADPVYAADGRSIYFVTDRGSAIRSVNVSESGEPIEAPTKLFDASASRIRQISMAADGKHIMYCALSTSGDIWSKPLSSKLARAAGDPYQLTQGRNMRNTFPNFSPDGLRIAFVVYSGGVNYQLWLMDPDGGKKSQVLTEASGPSWFPDGSRLSYVNERVNKKELWSVTVEGAKTKHLLDFDGDALLLRLSPDGTQVAFNSRQSGTVNVWVKTIEGGKTRQLTFDKELAGFPAWSRDGKWIAFQIKRGDNTHVCIVPSGGDEFIQLTNEKGQSWSHDWSPDSDKVLYAGQRNGVWNVYSVSRSSKAIEQLTNYKSIASYVRYPAWSPRNDRIAYEYAETTGNIWMIELK